MILKKVNLFIALAVFMLSFGIDLSAKTKKIDQHKVPV